jgi:hypothetical protein
LEHRRVQEAGEAGYVIVREQMGCVLIQESGGDENFELLVAIELENAANAVQDLPAHASFTRFQPAERATVDLGQVSCLFLGQTALVSEPRQHAS